MVNYKDLGLVNTREMFAKAIKGGYAIKCNGEGRWNNILFGVLYEIIQKRHYQKIRSTLC